MVVAVVAGGPTEVVISLQVGLELEEQRQARVGELVGELVGGQPVSLGSLELLEPGSAEAERV